MRTSRRGTFGRLRAEDATSLAMIISELVHNAVEHGLGAGGGTVEIEAERRVEDDEPLLEVCVADDGRGLPEGFNPGRSGLGTQIVHLAGAGPARADHLGTGGAARNRACGSSRGSGRSRTKGGRAAPSSG